MEFWLKVGRFYCAHSREVCEGDWDREVKLDEQKAELEGQLGWLIRWRQLRFLDADEDGRRDEYGDDKEDAADGSL